MMNQTKNLIDENGRRTDGRNPDATETNQDNCRSGKKC